MFKLNIMKKIIFTFILLLGCNINCADKLRERTAAAVQQTEAKAPRDLHDQVQIVAHDNYVAEHVRPGYSPGYIILTDNPKQFFGFLCIWGIIVSAVKCCIGN